MNRHYQQFSHQAKVAVYAATQSAVEEQRLFQGFVVLSAALALWVSLLG
jgi:hypothetical protein